MKSESYEFLKGSDNGHVAIGFGSYGMVKLAKNSETKELVAIKMIYNKNAKEEILVHKKLEHPNIVRLINYYFEKDRNVTYMVLEYADGGSLFERIKGSVMSKPLVRKIFQQVCSAIQTLHKNNVMHRDIKPQNILLTKKNDAKLCDFGFAAILGERKTLCGTYEYMAPEMIQNNTYDHKIDVWALGILLFEMIEGVAPFRGESPEEVLTEMKKSIYFSNKFDNKEIQLIKKILRVNPGNRPEVSAVLENPYFQEDPPEPILKMNFSAALESDTQSVKSPTSPRTADSKLQAILDTHHKAREKQKTQPNTPVQPQSPTVLISKYESFSSLQAKLANKPILKPTTPTLQQLIGKPPSLTGDMFPKEPATTSNRSINTSGGNGSFQSPWRR